MDAVKLQKRDNRTLFTRAMFDQPYDHENSFGRTYGEHREALELSDKDWFELMHQARELGITLFGATFDLPSADFLAELGVPAFKIASADLVNTPLLRQVASLRQADLPLDGRRHARGRRAGRRRDPADQHAALS